MKNHIPANLLNSCVKKCEKCIDSCQKLTSLCEIKSTTECADQVGICIRTCQECIQVCSKVVEEIQNHSIACKECKTELKSLQDCIDACKEHVKVLNAFQQDLPTNVDANEYRSDVEQLVNSTKKCIQKCNKCVEHCTNE